MKYDLTKVRLHDSPNPYVRFADLLPVKNLPARLPRDSRYTPIVHAKKLGNLLGMPLLYLKDETVLPTRSTKDRMAFVSLAYLWEHGVRSFCISSTGNSSTAYTNAIRLYPDMRVFVFTAESFIGRVQHAEHDQVRHFGLRDASFVEAFEAAAAYAKAHGHTSETGFFNLGRREGLKIAFLEDDIREARRMVEELEGLSPCFSASTAMAGLIKQVRKKSFPVKETVFVNLTGGERTGEPAPRKITWMQRGQNGWTKEKLPRPRPTSANRMDAA